MEYQRLEPVYLSSTSSVYNEPEVLLLLTCWHRAIKGAGCGYVCSR